MQCFVNRHKETQSKRTGMVFLNLGSLKWHFLHFASIFEQNLTALNHVF